jgi:hypothetical protein
MQRRSPPTPRIFRRSGSGLFQFRSIDLPDIADRLMRGEKTDFFFTACPLRNSVGTLDRHMVYVGFFFFLATSKTYRVTQSVME